MEDLLDDDFYAQIMAEEDEKIRLEIASDNRKNKALLKAIGAEFGKSLTNAIRAVKRELEDGEKDMFKGEYKIVDKPLGNIQKTENKKHEYWCNQHTGYLCDDYYGSIFIKLAENKFLEMQYSC